MPIIGPVGLARLKIQELQAQSAPSPSPAVSGPIAPTTPIFSPSPSPGLLDEYVLCSSPSPGVPVSSPLAQASAAPALGLCCETTCPGGNPNIQVTVSGIAWPDLDLDIGVHCVCPDTYNLGGTTETWRFYNATAQTSDSQIYFYAGATASRGQINVNYNTDTLSYTAGVTGRIQDRLFVVYTAGGLTATFQRGCGW
tara:strand:- start:453 stop:1043 length:591 start_codon:yes stop_codon:yes gene_type:complete